MHEEQNDKVEPAAIEPEPHDAPAAPSASPPMVAALTGARMPVDRGMSSLGLLMQLGGSLGVALAAVVAITVSLGGAGPATGVLFLFATLYGVRAAFHRMAGSALLYGKDSAPLRGVRTYIWLSIGQTAISLLLIKGYVDTASLWQLGAVLLGWPLTLLVYTSLPHIKQLMEGGVPDSEDHGFEGAAVLMTVFGIVGALFAGIALTALLEDPMAAFASPTSGIMVLVLIALVVRSIVHSLAGFKGISGADFDECNASASRYYNMGIASALCIGIALFVVLAMTTHSLGAALTVGVFSASMLLAWPNILRRLYAERNFDVYLAGDNAPTFQRAPDAGLIALGWTLVAVAVFGLGRGLAQALFAEPLTAEDLQVMAMMMDEEGLAQLDRSAWWSVGVSGLQLWAGIELVRMSERHKLAAMIYGAVSAAVVLYVLWPAMDQLDAVFTAVFGDSGALFTHAFTLGTGFNLILAISTIVLVNRVTVPSAVVHIRKGNAQDT